ncbi:tetratricopeptide repeat protein [Nitratireductor basaltis]|uniref:Putative O-linked N-acetylglucosamine transferase, SPINDLY family n=1 Tax=Nitratireductor basaltis TaxID=472175 RepID=A0A084UC96_9HYPH|nr:tetratricopeptide repeat protein [Nitratireductor basaltis]KFB10582.1 putative O-linked N-acetylglucosamine transferase, SPINDLY family [Nitratireductor basaltis]
MSFKPGRLPPMAHKVTPQTNKLLRKLGDQFSAHFQRGDFNAAFKVVERGLRLVPTHPTLWRDAAACMIHMRNWEQALRCASRAHELEPENYQALDSLAHASGMLGDPAAASNYGRRALELRDVAFRTPKTAWRVTAPPPFEPLARGRNVISFSLFGSDPKYCETAIANAEARPAVYPEWSMRFHVNDSVPHHVIDRLLSLGAEIHYMRGEQAQWPGPMWRFLAYDDPDVDRVMFRDADSIIGERESAATREWVESGKSFHIIRDFCSHTELILAGLWSAARGALPPMHDMIGDFVARGVKSRHFADQYFLREYVWPLARGHMLQHDSLFGFGPFKQIPAEPDPGGHHIGCLAAAGFRAKHEAADGTRIVWSLFDATRSGKPTLCSYPGVIRNKAVEAMLPLPWLARIQAGELGIRVSEAQPVASAS